MSVDPWTYTRVRVTNVKDEVPYDRVRKRAGGAIHLAHQGMLITECGVKLGGRRADDPKPILSNAEPTCLRCKGAARRRKALGL